MAGSDRDSSRILMGVKWGRTIAVQTILLTRGALPLKILRGGLGGGGWRREGDLEMRSIDYI